MKDDLTEINLNINDWEKNYYLQIPKGIRGWMVLIAYFILYHSFFQFFSILFGGLSLGIFYNTIIMLFSIVLFKIIDKIFLLIMKKMDPEFPRKYTKYENLRQGA